MELSSWESTPEARAPAPRKPTLRQAQRIIRRYFLLVFVATGVMSASASPELWAGLRFAFFVDFTSIITPRTSVMTKSSRCVLLAKCSTNVHHWGDENAT